MKIWIQIIQNLCNVIAIKDKFNLVLHFVQNVMVSVGMLFGLIQKRKLRVTDLKKNFSLKCKYNVDHLASVIIQPPHA